MLRDAPRCSAYARALSAANLEGKAVLDVGAGTGLLSILAAKFGARVVYSCEASGLAAAIGAAAQANGVGDVVKVMHCRAEVRAAEQRRGPDERPPPLALHTHPASLQCALTRGLHALAGRRRSLVGLQELELPEKVDVIVSEWMGFHLYHECMLESVLRARDAWLSPSGLMVPGRCRVMAAPVCADAIIEERLAPFADCEGVDLSVFIGPAAQQLLEANPQVTVLEQDALLAQPRCVDEADLHVIPAAEAGRCGDELVFVATREAVCHGYALWFECDFFAKRPSSSGEGADDDGLGDMGEGDEPAVVLSTGPEAPPTHWKQTVVLLPEQLGATPGARLDCAFRLAPDARVPRNCVLQCAVGGSVRELEQEALVEAAAVAAAAAK